MGDFIQLLPDNIANQIAAGEVIQRPASVVKELVENAIDAGADKISVNIKDAGKTLIQVVDNGGGMSASDAELCFERHATSKVRKAEDLFALTTKGFRGEALASIAAIAHVSLKTKRVENETGTKIEIEGSKINLKEDVVCPQGTSFEVKNLFYNVPARRNFLKKDNTEFNRIQDEFERVALAHPSIHFTLNHNDSEIYNLPPAVLRKRIVNVLGNNANDRLVPIDESTDIVTLKGFVLKPEHARKTRGDQFFFVNDRYFKSSYFNHAVTKAFDGLLKTGTYPGYFLYLDVNPEKIDVNVHPTKTEIKFEEERFIYSILLSSIRLALGKYNIAPTLEFNQESSFDLPHSMKKQTPIEPTIKVDTAYNPFNTSARSSSTNKGNPKENFSKAINQHGFGNVESTQEDWKNFYTIEEEIDENAESIQTPENTSIPFENNTDVSAQFIMKGNYIISPSRSGIMLIHIRRAIEQIVYTDTLNTFVNKPIDSQALLFPLEKELSKNEALTWNNSETILKQLGFNGKVKDNILTLSAVPASLQEETISTSLEEIFSTLQYQDVKQTDISHSLVAALAKSASMKKININSNEEIQHLVDQLFQCENHMHTPRNKKIIETISMEELTAKFM